LIAPQLPVAARSSNTPTSKLFTNPLHPYTEALLAAVPIPNPQLKRKKGTLPDRRSCAARS
jgi:ABC-type oligopeptide transport system ATPase subunit